MAAESPSRTLLTTLVLSDVVDSTKITARVGDAHAAEIFGRHDSLVRSLLAQYHGEEISHSDGFLVLFERPVDALRYALSLHDALDNLGQEFSVKLHVRVGIHLGELVAAPGEAGSPSGEYRGLAIATTARVMQLAQGGQTLFTKGAFDLARRGAVGAEGLPEGLQWLAHGPYLLKGVEEPIEISEAGVPGKAPLAPPPDSEKARRAVAPGDEITLGWRPSVALQVPLRRHWILVEKIGEGGVGEAWLGEHEKTKEKRVFKFCFDAARLRGLKREVTLFRLLKESLGTRSDITRILDFNFDEAPFFLESEYSPGGDLARWSERQGGIANVPIAVRLDIVAQVADALHAAHSAGILHKDIKPPNVLIREERGGTPLVSLADFGIGLLADKDLLAQKGITALGFTETLLGDAVSSQTGTRLYMAPEVLEGKAATTATDVYALGVLLYQMALGDFGRALAPGWRRLVADDILREDIAACVEGTPEERLSSAAELARRLRSVDQRRAEAEEQQRRARVGERRRRYARLSPIPVLAVALLAAGVWGWDHTRLKVRYYANFIERWGVPEGVGPLSEETRSHRGISCRFEIRGGKVQRVRRENSAGAPRSAEDGIAEWRIYYRENGKVERVEERDRDGNVMRTRNYSPDLSVIDFRQSGRAQAQRARAFDPLFGSLSRFSMITQHRVEYGPDGRPTRGVYQDSYGTPRSDANGVYGETYEYSPNGIERKRMDLGQDGKPCLHRNGVAGVRDLHNERGDLIEQTTLDMDGRPTIASDSGYATLRLSWDKWGNQVKQAYFDVDRKPVMHRGGWAALLIQYDARGNQARVSRLDLRGQAVPGGSDWAIWTGRFDRQGNLMEAAYWDAHGSPVAVGGFFGFGGFAKRTVRYDDHGRGVEVRYFDVHGNLTLTTNGFATVRFAYDRRGNDVEAAFFGVDGKPVRTGEKHDGPARITYAYDEAGRLVEEATFGVDGKPAPALPQALFVPHGAAKKRYSYDPRGNQSEILLFGVDGRPLPEEKGFARQVSTYDDRGFVVETSFYGRNGKPIKDSLSLNCARVTSAYDAKGNQVECAYFDVDGKPTLGIGGAAVNRTTYDNLGRPIETRYLGTDGRPVLQKDGYARVVCAWDRRGNQTEESYFDTGGRPVLQKNGYAKRHSVFDERGREIERAFFDTEGKPVADKETGAAKIRYQYKATGEKADELRFDAQGKLLPPKTPVPNKR